MHKLFSNFRLRILNRVLFSGDDVLDDDGDEEDIEDDEDANVMDESQDSADVSGSKTPIKV